jgi:hypothetical protein
MPERHLAMSRAQPAQPDARQGDRRDPRQPTYLREHHGRILMGNGSVVAAGSGPAPINPASAATSDPVQLFFG